jgi:hypothetical protein
MIKPAKYVTYLLRRVKAARNCVESCQHTAWQARLLHSPAKGVHTILTEKNLVPEYRGGHTPTTGGIKRALVRFDFIGMVRASGGDSGIKRSKIESGSGGSTLELVPFMPIHSAAKNQA